MLNELKYTCTYIWPTSVYMAPALLSSDFGLAHMALFMQHISSACVHCMVMCTSLLHIPERGVLSVLYINTQLYELK
jgi:hypothetical protein